MLLKALLYLATLGYIAVWLLLLVDCLRRKEFYPVLGNGLGTKVFWLATFLFFNPLLTLLYLIFGRLARPTARPSFFRTGLVVVPVLAILCASSVPWSRPGSKAVTVRRDPADGSLKTDGGGKAGVEAHLTVFEARDGINSSSVTFSGNRAGFPCRRIALLNQSRHPLMERVGVEVQKRLAQLPFVEEVAYYPAGTRPPEGQSAPDVVIQLDAPQLKMWGLPFYRRLTAEIQVLAGPSPYQSNSHYSDHMTPPVLGFEWNGSLSHQSTMTGYETAGAKYKLAADDLAGEIAKALSKQFGDWMEKYGPTPSLPESFYGAYHSAPKLAFLPGDSVECVQSNCGLMKHNHTVWRFVDDRDTSVALRAIKSQLERDGWKDRTSEISANGPSLVRMEKGTERIQVFRQQRHETGRAEIRTTSGQPPAQMPVVVQYEDLYSDQETEKALSDLLESGAPTDTLIAFENLYRSGRLRDRFSEAIENRKATSAEGNLVLAELYESRGEKEKARQALLRAAVLLKLQEDQGDIKRRIEDLAKKLGDEKMTQSPVSEETFRGLGFTEVTTAPATIESEVALDEPVLVCGRSEGEKDSLLSVRVRQATARVQAAPRDGKSPRYALHHLVAQNGGRSWTSIGLEVAKDGRGLVNQVFSLPSGLHGAIQAESLGKGRFRIRIDFLR